jgi:hypothetical protein
MFQLRGFAVAAAVVVAGTWGAVAECDALQPSLTDFDFSPKLVDVGPGPASVTCTMTVDEDLSGVAEATCQFISPSFVQSRSCTAEAPSSGDRLSGTFTCTVEFPEHVEGGVWTANSVTLVDRVGRARSVSSFELQSSGFPTELSVTSPQPDLTGPQIDGFDFTPKSVDVTVSGRDVTCTMDWSDPIAGVQFAQCSFTSPSGEQAQGCGAFEPSSGSPNDGTYECSFTVPRYSEDGTWLASVFSLDEVGNSATVDPDGLGAQGFPTDLQVTSDPDLSPPSLDDFDLQPTSVDVSTTNKTVTCTMTFSDALAGVTDATCEIGFLDGFAFLAHSCTASEPATGTRNDGVFRCDVVIPAYSPSGTWQVQDVSARDAVGNELVLTTAELAARGLPTDVAVTCEGGGSGEEETTLSWSDKQTLTWDPVPDAVEYDTYRGPIASLSDGDGDGLPDQGYGDCQNSSDPDTTDTQFVDEEIPSPQDGFFYLVGYDTASESGLGLGATSAGLDRTPTTPCP